jgi:predicted transcriptional regulator
MSIPLNPIPVESPDRFRYTKVMTMREKAIQAEQALPDDASLEDAMERLFLLAKIERGLQQADTGELIPHEKVKERMAKWLR